MYDHKYLCFNNNLKFWTLLGISPENKLGTYYRLYSILLAFILVFIYTFLATINFIYLPLQMDAIIEEIIFYTAEIGVCAKVCTFLSMRKQIKTLFVMLNGEILKPKKKRASKIVGSAIEFIGRLWKINAVLSIVSNLVHGLSPVILHIVTGSELTLLLCSYSFLHEDFIKDHIYALYFYQTVGMQVQMLINVNVDTFIWGLQIMTIAELDILEDNLIHIGDKENKEESNKKLKDCVKHFDEISRFNILLQDVFSIVIFVQFSLASIIICVCLFRFSLPATGQYYIFLLTYMFIMVFQIFVPCWFGSNVILKSSHLSLAAYKCNWTSQSSKFKSTLRLFVERCNNPIMFIGGKMFPVSLITFTSIIKSAYSFFTLLRHIQARDPSE